jgi:hypothetical protein
MGGSPINLPSVGPINASSGVRHKDFKAGWNNNKADDDTDNEMENVELPDMNPKDEHLRKASERLD